MPSRTHLTYSSSTLDETNRDSQSAGDFLHSPHWAEIDPQSWRKGVSTSVHCQSLPPQAYPGMESKASEEGESGPSFSSLACRSLGTGLRRSDLLADSENHLSSVEVGTLLAPLLLEGLEPSPSFRLCWHHDSVLTSPKVWDRASS